MNRIQITIILVASFIILILIGVIIFVILRNKNSNQKKKLAKIIKDTFEGTSLKVVEVMFKRIDTIAGNNSKYKDSRSVFEGKLDNIYKKEGELKNDAQEFLGTINTINKKERSVFISTFKRKASILNDIIRSFIDNASITLQAEQFLRKEVNYYQERYKMVIIFYQQIATKIEYISDELTLLNNEVVALYGKFNSYFDAGEVDKCTITLEKYRAKILLLARILDEAPIIGDIIYNQIPSIVNKLVDHFKSAKDSLKSDIKYINFGSTLRKIRDRYMELKKSYSKMDMEQSKGQIIWIFKNVKSLEIIINNEIRSRKSVLTYYDIFHKKTTEVLTNYVTIKRQIKSLIKNNHVGNEEQELLEQMNSIAKEINDNAVLLMNNWKNTDMPFSSKNIKMKQAFELEFSLIMIMNKLFSQISHAKNFRLNFSNKLKYVSAVTASLYKKINILQMHLTEEEEGRLEDLDHKLLEIEKMIIMKNLNFELINSKFWDIENRVISISRIIGGKQEAAAITKNLMSHFAPKRKLDKMFNQKVNLAEREYLSGQYIKALNTIITGIEMVK